MQLTRTGTFHRLKTVSKTGLPAGTIMWHYAIVGTKEEIAEFEESKGDELENVPTFDKENNPKLDSKFHGMYFQSSSKQLCPIGESVEAQLVKGYVNPVTTEEQAITESATQLENRAKEAQIKKLEAAVNAGDKSAIIKLAGLTGAKLALS